MSRNDWEHGTLTLPAAAVPGIKAALREHINRTHDDVRAQVARLHQEVGKGTRSPKTYSERLNDWRQRVLYAPTSSYRQPSAHQTTVLHIADAVLAAMVAAATPSPWRTDTNITAIHKPTVAEIARFAPRLTNRDTLFPVLGRGGDQVATITIKGRELTWDAPESNHARDGAREGATGVLLFDLLCKVQWTRGTGGVLVGNDEYNRDSDWVGGGANYVTERFGPLGAKDLKARDKAFAAAIRGR